MRVTWINRQGNKNCILFFNGWGMDEHAVSHLDKGNLDICMLNEFNPISSIEELIKDYKEIYLVAWSLGVWVASTCLSNSIIKSTKSIAINGTQKPIDDNFGISVAVFNHTLETWNEANRFKFNMRIMGGRSQYEIHIDRLAERTIKNQQEELRYIEKEVISKNVIEITFDTVLIGTTDLIFNPVNQYNYWQGKSKIIKVDVPHYPFSMFKSWQEIIDL